MQESCFQVDQSSGELSRQTNSVNPFVLDQTRSGVKLESERGVWSVFFNPAQHSFQAILPPISNYCKCRLYPRCFMLNGCANSQRLLNVLSFT